MGLQIDPSEVSRSYRLKLRDEVARLGERLKLVGFLASDYKPSLTYASYTQAGCEDVGINFETRRINRLELDKAIEDANVDPAVHGIIVYYPIFGTERDGYIKDIVDFRKDIEGLNIHWAQMLYRNERFIDSGKTQKALLPCTPLAVIKLLDAAGEFTGPNDAPLANKTVTIFNRSEVVGRPLAHMLANDGATVYSFDIDGPLLFRKTQSLETAVTRREALQASDIVITGVPSKDFPLVRADEIQSNAVCVNFSTLKNYDEAAARKARVFIPRVGPMTVTMALRNTLRLYKNYHARSRTP